MVPESAARRLWARTDKSSDGCWPCSLTPARAYPQIIVDGRRMQASHVAYELGHGVAVADCPGMEVLHGCDNPRCVRPDHLHLGTHRQNMREAAERGRFGHAHGGERPCRHGHFDWGRDKRGYLFCRTCKRLGNRETERRRRAKRKAVAP